MHKKRTNADLQQALKDKHKALEDEKRTNAELHESLSGLRKFSLQELRRLTGDFSAGCKVGAGRFGAVYRVTGLGPRVLAAKVLAADSLQEKRSSRTKSDC